MLTKEHEGQYIRLNGLRGENFLKRKPVGRVCFVIVKVWRDGIQVRHVEKSGTSFIGPSRYNQSAEVYPLKEFRLLPYDYGQEENRF
jgi:hypothetical protein